MWTLIYASLVFVAWKGFGKLGHALQMLGELPAAPSMTAPPQSWPAVVVQLPMYDERRVVTRLLRSVARLDYPLDLLHVQVLDDSDDATSALVERHVRLLRRRGLSIDHLRRTDRHGFKAGALANGLRQSSAPFVALFDADFVVPPDFLRRTLPAFADARIAAVQGRWGHLNRNANLLTRLQALILDSHFVVSHVRTTSEGRLNTFNGSGGVWRRDAIVDAGGWQGDTLSEDVDLSYRAQLRGWHIVYRDDIVVPGELPLSLAAYRGQRQRWVAGTTQVACKLWSQVWGRSRAAASRRSLLLQLAYPIVFPLLVAPLTYLLPCTAMLLVLIGGYALLGLISLTTILLWSAAVMLSYAAALRRSLGHVWPDIALAPLAIGLEIFLSPGNARAALRALSGASIDFVRTPKHGSRVP